MPTDPPPWARARDPTSPQLRQTWRAGRVHAMNFVPPKPGAAPNHRAVLETLHSALEQVRALAALDHAPDVYAAVAVDLSAVIAKLDIFVPPNPGAVPTP
jgi:hypothetical protein